MPNDGSQPADEAGPAGAASMRVAGLLRDAILSGQIRPGERLRQEDLAERYGASRLPVREALRILEAEGLTELQPNKGARVAKLDMHELDALYRIRERLEPLALAESIPNLSPADLDHIDDIQAQIEANTSVAKFVALDRDLHLMTYSGCRIESLNQMVRRMWNTTQHYRRAFVTATGPERMWVVSAEHRLLIDAIKRKDVVDAERFLSGHVRRTRIELADHPELFDGGGQPPG